MQTELDHPAPPQPNALPTAGQTCPRSQPSRELNDTTTPAGCDIGGAVFGGVAGGGPGCLAVRELSPRRRQRAGVRGLLRSGHLSAHAPHGQG